MIYSIAHALAKILKPSAAVVLEVGSSLKLPFSFTSIHELGPGSEPMDRSERPTPPTCGPGTRVTNCTDACSLSTCFVAILANDIVLQLIVFCVYAALVAQRIIISERVLEVDPVSYAAEKLIGGI